MRKIEFTCQYCNKEFISKKACRGRTPKFCSQKCYGMSIADMKKCVRCGKEFYNYKNKYFCSMACAGANKIGKKLTDDHKKALSEARKGRFCFEKHTQWKGDDVGYGALHEWVYRVMGSPMTCEQCGTIKENNRQIHWANRTGEYKRDPSDWVRLCVPCHKRNDLQRRKNVQDHVAH